LSTEFYLTSFWYLIFYFNTNIKTLSYSIIKLVSANSYHISFIHNIYIALEMKT